MRKLTEQLDITVTAKGSTKKIKLYSYVITLTEQDGSEVKAIRADGFQNIEDVYAACLEQWPGWNIKTISKLYETDFDIH